MGWEIYVHTGSCPRDTGICCTTLVTRGISSALSVGDFDPLLQEKRDRLWRSTAAETRTRETLEKPGAGERIRTVDLRITSASSENLAQSEESPESQNPHKTETSETEGNPVDP